MGWKDLFKSKATKAKPDPRLRWFGKLPTYADYYSSSTDEEWAIEFNDWVLKGFETYISRQRNGARGERLPSAAGIVRLPKSRMTVLTSVQDYGGDMRGRPFPLCFYVGVPSALWPGPACDQVAAGLRMLRDLTDLRRDVFRFFNAPGRFETTFGGREFDLEGIDEESRDESWMRAARALNLGEWFETAKECLKTDDLAAWCQAMTAWGDNIARLESEEFGPTLRFPLVMTIPFEVQVGGWLRWLEHRMNISERFLSLIVCRNNESDTGRLTVIAREIVPEDFLLMTPLAESLSYVDDVCALAGRRESDSSAGEKTASAAVSVRAPVHWADFVDVAAST